MDIQTARDNLPTGTVTFMFTDIEGSTTLWERYPDVASSALIRHDELVEAIVAEHHGSLVRPRGEGDSRFAVFARASDAAVASVALQRALSTEPWPTPAPLKVRMALHTGEADLRGGDYYGTAVNRCARLRAAAHGGQTLLSQAAADMVSDSLPDGVALYDLGEHRLKDLQRPERIFQLVIPGLPSEFPPLNTLDARPNNLPVQTTPFIGREKQVEALENLLGQPQIRLVTLTGPGGTGKTRLALQAAAVLLERFQDGVFFVPLAQFNDPDLVAAPIAQALGVSGRAGQPLIASVTQYLRDRELLLLLDNFEQVLEAVSLVREILQASARSKAIVTSREVLHLYGEKEFPVPPLNLPDPRQLPALDQLAQYEAIRLFVDRAMLSKPDFSITEENAPAVAEICCRLDGLPLAIELAAARIKLLPPRAMLARLASSLSVLTGGARDLPARQQTLRDAMQWSYDLLTGDEQSLFIRASIFAGGCTLEAAEAVCRAAPALDFDVLDGMSSLMDKSLLSQQETADEPRFSMLVTIREFGLERLAASGLAGALESAHAGFYLETTERWKEAYSAGGDQASGTLLQPDTDNLRSALVWSLENDTDVALRFCAALVTFWYFQGLIAEGRRRTEQAIALPDAPQSPFYAGAILALSALLGIQGERTAARERFQQAFSLAQGDQREWLIAQARSYLALVISLQGDLKIALDIAQQIAELSRKAHDEFNLAEALTASGTARTFLGDYAAARSDLEESFALFRKLGHKIGIARSSSALGDLARIEGDYAGARVFYNISLPTARSVSSGGAIAALTHNFGHLALAEGDDAQARKLFDESLALHMQTEDTGGIAESLAGYAGVARARHQPERAARLLAAATSLWEANNISMWPAEKTEFERNLSAARSQLDDASWNKAWQEGLDMTMAQAIAYGRDEAD